MTSQTTGATGPKFKSETQRLVVRERIVQLDARGHTQTQIARLITEEFGVRISQPTAGAYLRAAREEALAESKEEVIDRRDKLLRELAEVQREAWAAFERGKKDSESETTEEALVKQFAKALGQDGKPKVKGEKLKLIKRILRREGRLPPANYLSIVVECVKEKGRLLGLSTGDVNFNLLFQSGDAKGPNWEEMLFDDAKPAAPAKVDEATGQPLNMLPPSPAAPPSTNGVNGKGN